MPIYKEEISIKEMIRPNAEKRAKAVEQLANNLDLEALEILADKSKKDGMSKKVKKFKKMM